MAVTRMRFSGTGGGIHYIDLNKALSLQLRKLHRQKVITTVYGGFFAIEGDAAGTSTRISLNTAPNTWVTKRAINRGFASWRKMIAKTLENAEGVTTGKWNDFKIYLNNGHGSSPLLPQDCQGNDLYDPATTGNVPEWDYSTLTTENEDSVGDQFELMIVGPSQPGPTSFTRVGLIDSWFATRPKPSIEVVYPNDAEQETDPLANLFDAGAQDDERLDVINAEGDLPPYDRHTAFGNATASGSGNNLQRVSIASCNTSLQVAPVHGFEAICGLVEIAITDPNGDTNWELVLDVESKGVKF